MVGSAVLNGGGGGGGGGGQSDGKHLLLSVLTRHTPKRGTKHTIYRLMPK